MSRRGTRDGGNRPITPGWSVAIITNPLVRRVLGGDLPERDVRWAGIREGMRVYEIGAGGGLYSSALAGAVGPKGILVAGEIHPRSAAYLRRRMGAKGHRNVLVHRADGNALPLRDGAMDALCAFYSVEEIPGVEEMAPELTRVVAPGGFMVLFLWRPLIRRRRREKFLAGLEQLGFERVAVWKTFQNYKVVMERRARPAGPD